MGWLEEKKSYQDAKFTEKEIFEEEQRQRSEMFRANFTSEEIDEYFGVKKFDPTEFKKLVDKNLEEYRASQSAEGAAPKEATSFWEAVEAGLQISVSGLAKRGKMPDLTVSEDSGMFYRIANQVGTLVGDVPAMLGGMWAGGAAGSAVGGAVGSAVPVVGTAAGGAVGGVLGAGGGSFALPTAMRKILMDHYEKGDVQGFGDFWERASATFVEASKGFVVGAATSGVGGAVGKVAAPLVKAGTTATVRTASEIATMVTVGKALEGDVPEPQDFIDAAIVVGGLHGVAKVSSKFRKVYGEFGVKPEVAAGAAAKDPLVKQEMLAENTNFEKVGEIIVGEKVEVPKAPLQSSYEYAPIDVNQSVEGKIFYHGTKSDLSALSKAEVTATSSVNNLYGEGLYLTDNPEVAKSYAANKGKGPTGKVLAAKLGDLKLVDLEQPLPPEVLKILNGFAQSITRDDTAVFSSQAKGTFVYDRIKDYMADAGYYRSDAIEIFQQINMELMDKGFDGLRHEGGNRVAYGNRGKHNVVIVFDRADGTGVSTRLQDAGHTPTIQSPRLSLKPPVAAKPPTGAVPDFENNVMGSIGKKAPKGKEPFTFSKFYQDFVDRLDPIKRLEKQLLEVQDGGKVNLAPDEQPYLLSRLAADWKSKLKYVLEKGTIDHATLAKNGESLKDIVNPHKGELDLLDGYLKARGAKDYYKKGLNPGIAEADATAFVAKYKDRFEATAKRITDWSNRNLQMLRDAGRLSKEEYNIIVEANENYVPFKRLLETEDGLALKPSKEGLLKERTGSDLKTQSPLTSLIENAETTMRLVENNRATSKLAEIIETYGDESVGQKVQGRGPLKENQFETYRNGEREVWEMKDKSVAQAVKALGGDVSSQNIFLKIARGLTLAKKVGISMTPEFILRNFVRDQLTASVFSNQWHLPVIDTLIAMKDVFGKSEAYYNWIKSGGANGSFLGINESYFKKDILKLNEKTGFLKSTWNIVEKPFDMMKVSASIVEEATRLAEFKRVTKGETQGARVFEGGFAAREVTVDFQRIGAKMAALNSITAFQNVSIQGLDRTVRALKENPKAISAATALITTTSVAVWFANKDEEWYREIPQWERDLFWHLKGGDIVFRFPKPQELGIMFGSVPERILEAYVKDNPNAFKEMSDTIGGLMVPSFMPDALSTPFEQMVNRSFFTGNPIVSQAAEKLLPAYQFNDYTSESAKAIGKLIDFIPYIKDIGPDDAKLASPMVVENYVRGWTGTLGMYVLKAVDFGLVKTGAVKDQKPAGTLADMPFIKAFVTRYPHANTQSIQNFREKYKKAERVFSTIKQLGSRGQLDEAMEVAQMYEGDMIRLTNQKEALTNMHKAIQGIYMSDYTKDEKRQLIDSVYFQMIAVARDGNAMLNDMEKAISKRKFQNRLRLP